MLELMNRQAEGRRRNRPRKEIAMKNDYFENKVVTSMCILLRAQKAAIALDDSEAVRQYGARYEGFMDALRCTLSGSYIARLVSLANEKINAEG